MAIFDTLKTKVRSVLQEFSKSTKDIFTFNSSRIFSLSEENTIDVSEVYVNDDAVGESGDGWSYSSSSNKVTIGDSYTMTSGDIVEVHFTYYPNYSDTEIENYIKAAIYHISINGYKTFEVNDDDINPELTESEENLVAIVAGILIKPDNNSYRTPDLTITVPISSIPTQEMIRRVVSTFKKNTHGIFSIIDLDGNNPLYWRKN